MHDGRRRALSLPAREIDEGRAGAHRVQANAFRRDLVTASTRAMRAHGPFQSNGMCLLEFVVHSN